VIAGHKVGDVITLSLTRGTNSLEVKATLVERPAEATVEPNAPIAPTASASTERPMLGIQLEDTANGPVIRDVVAGSPAEKAGLKIDDVLTKIGTTAVKDAASASAAVQAHKVGDQVAIEVTRDGKTVTVNATLAAVPASAFSLSQNGISINYDGTSKQWLISALPQDSDLYKAGLREGDKITKFDGTAYDPAALAEYLSKATADVTLTVTRDGKDQEIKVPAATLMTLAMGGFGMGSGNQPFFNIPFNGTGGGSRLGVQFVTLDPSVAKEHKVTETVGALVTQVMPQSPADKAGIKANDVVTKVDGSEVNAEHTLRDLLATYKPGDSVKLDVIHDGKTNQLSVTLDQAPANSAFPFPFSFGQGGSDGSNGFPFPLPTPQPSSPLDNGTAM